MSDTPRTDALYCEWNGEQAYPPEYVRSKYPRSVWELCKEFERKLAATKADKIQFKRAVIMISEPGFLERVEILIAEMDDQIK